MERGASWSLSALTLAFAFVSLTIIKSHRPHLPSLSISARLFCPGNARIELPAEEATLYQATNTLLLSEARKKQLHIKVTK